VNQPGDAVEKAAAQEIELEETQRRTQQHPGRARAPAARVQRFGLERGVAVLFGKIIREPVFGLVQQVSFQASDRCIGHHLLVDRIVAPVGMAAVEQPQRPVGIALAVAQPAAEEAVAARELVGLETRRLQFFKNACAQGVAHTFVGVYAQHPVVACLADRELFLPAEAEPVLLHNLGIEAAGDVEGGVPTARVHYHDFGGPGTALQTGFESRGDVAGDENSRQARVHGAYCMQTLGDCSGFSRR
jgi:hypothetical protein